MIKKFEVKNGKNIYYDKKTHTFYKEVEGELVPVNFPEKNELIKDKISMENKVIASYKANMKLATLTLIGAISLGLISNKVNKYLASDYHMVVDNVYSSDTYENYKDYIDMCIMSNDTLTSDRKSILIDYWHKIINNKFNFKYNICDDSIMYYGNNIKNNDFSNLEFVEVMSMITGENELEMTETIKLIDEMDYKGIVLK